MHGHTILICASAVAVATFVSAAQTDIQQLQRRSHRHDSLRMVLKRSEHGNAIKPRNTGPATLPITDVNIPNSSPGINTPDNVALDTYTEDAGCTAYYAVQEGDICDSILEANPTFNTSLDLFYTMNPSIDSECTNLKPGLAYCIGSATPANAAPETITVEEGCTRYQTIKEGDYCLSVVEEVKYLTGLTLEDFYKANPMLDSLCSNLWLGYSYCVGVEGAVVEEQPETLPLLTEGDVPAEEDCPYRRQKA